MPDLIQQLLEPFSWDFVIRAMVAGTFVSLSCSVLGVFLVLRRFSLIGDGLAHVSFATVALSLLFSVSPLVLSVPLVILASFAISRMARKSGIQGDTAIGLLSSSSIALGVLIASLSRGFNVDILSYLFGSILVIGTADVWVSAILSLVILVVVVLFFNTLVLVSFDEDYAAASGIKTGHYNTLLLVLASVAVVTGIRVAGTMLVSSFIVFPASIALQLKRGFISTIIIAAATGVGTVLLGVYLSYQFNLPAGASVVLLNAATLGIVTAAKALARR